MTLVSFVSLVIFLKFCKKLIGYLFWIRDTGDTVDIGNNSDIGDIGDIE